MTQKQPIVTRYNSVFHRIGLICLAVLAILYSSRIGVNANRCSGSSHGDCLGRGRSGFGDSCDDRSNQRRSYSGYYPRRYDYHRRSTPWQDSLSHRRRHFNPRTSAMDLLGDIFSIPIYSSDVVNSLLRQQLNRQIDQFAVTAPVATLGSRRQLAPDAPSYAIEDTSSHLQLTMEVPGVDSRDLTLELVQEHGTAVLNVRGHRLLRLNGSVVESTFARAFQLDKDSIDMDAIQAKLSAGILIITAPKKESQAQLTKRQLEISVEDGDQDYVDSTIVEKTNDSETVGDVAKSSANAEGDTIQQDPDDFVISEDDDL